MYWRRLGLSGIGGCQWLGCLKGCRVGGCVWNGILGICGSGILQKRCAVWNVVLWGGGINLRPLRRRKIWFWDMVFLVRLTILWESMLVFVLVLASSRFTHTFSCACACACTYAYACIVHVNQPLQAETFYKLFGRIIMTTMRNDLWLVDVNCDGNGQDDKVLSIICITNVMNRCLPMSFASSGTWHHWCFVRNTAVNPFMLNMLSFLFHRSRGNRARFCWLCEDDVCEWDTWHVYWKVADQCVTCCQRWWTPGLLCGCCYDSNWIRVCHFPLSADCRDFLQKWQLLISINVISSTKEIDMRRECQN